MVGVAQLVSASDCGSEGRGFEPLYPPFYKYGEIAQLARARGSYPRCRGFESPSRYSRGVAQVVERFVRDEEAASSSLVTPTEKPLKIDHCKMVYFFVVFGTHLLCVGCVYLLCGCCGLPEVGILPIYYGSRGRYIRIYQP